MLMYSRNVRDVFVQVVRELCKTASPVPVVMETRPLFQDLKDLTLLETVFFLF
jgi:hypothetical protein